MILIDGSECLRHLARIERRVLDVPRVGLNEVVRVAYRNARGTTLFKDGSHELRDTMDIVDVGAYRKRLIFRARHGKFVNDGTKPHAIVPRRAKMLRFVVNGRVVFAARVQHPGTARRPVLENAAMAGSQAMSVIMNEGVQAAVRYPA